MTLFLELLAVAALILLNGFFVAAEYALVTVRRTRLQEMVEEGNRRANRVLGLTAVPPRFIAAMQLGVTVTSLAIGALGEHALVRLFDPIMATAIAVAIALLLLTFFHVVVGELVPKGISLGHSERTALLVAQPVRLFFFLLKPLIWFLQISTELTLRLLGLEPPGAEGAVYSEAELKLLLERSTVEGELEAEEQEMLYKVFDFADKEAGDVMVPRPEVVVVAADMPPEECLRKVLESPYTRFPVYRETAEHIVGVLHLRDTLEDVIEEIVGEIEDEFDLPDESVERIDDTRIRIEGTFPIDDFNEQFDTELPIEDYHTMGGFVFGLLGRAPEQGDELEENALRFTVIELEGTRIDRLEVEFLPKPEHEQPPEQRAAEA
jgi:CBS domain containing-hemolysin-like protein